MQPAPAAVIAEMQAEHDAAVLRVMAANADIAERVAAMPHSVYYDPEDDIALALIGPLVPCVLLELHDSVALRLDPITDKVVGFEFPDTKRHQNSAPAIVRLMVDSILGLTEGSPATFLPQPTAARERMAEDARQLVCV